MTEFKSEQVSLAAPIEKVYGRFSNLENLKTLIDNAPADRIPADKLEQLKQMEVTPDSITLSGGPTGTITMRVCERREPELVALRPEGLPLQMQLELRFTPLSPDSTGAVAAITADLPAMMRPMVKGPLQKVVDQFAEMMASIPF